MADRVFNNHVFESWMETHYEVVSYIEHALDNEDHLLQKECMDGGRGRMYEISRELTDMFEARHKDTEWDGEWLEKVWEFLDDYFKK